MVEESFGVVREDDLAIVEDKYMIRACNDRPRVAARHHHSRVRLPAPYRFNDLQYLGRAYRIEFSSGIVEHENRRQHRQYRSDRHPLFLAPRQAVRRNVGVGWKLSPRSSAQSMRSSMTSRSVPRFSSPKATLVFDTQAEEIRLRILKNDADLRRNFDHRTPFGIDIVDPDIAPDRAAHLLRYESVERQTESRLSTTGRPEDAEKLAGIDCHRHVLQNPALIRFRIVGIEWRISIVEVFDTYERHMFHSTHVILPTECDHKHEAPHPGRLELVACLVPFQAGCCCSSTQPGVASPPLDGRVGRADCQRDRQSNHGPRNRPGIC